MVTIKYNFASIRSFSLGEDSELAEAEACYHLQMILMVLRANFGLCERPQISVSDVMSNSSAPYMCLVEPKYSLYMNGTSLVKVESSCISRVAVVRRGPVGLENPGSSVK